MSTVQVPDVRVTVGTYEGWLYGWEHDNGAKGNVEEPGAGSEVHSSALSNFMPKSGPRLDDGGMSLVFALEAHVGVVRCATLMEAKGGDLLATGGEDESIRIYNLKKRREVGELVQHTGGITSLKFVGKKHLLSASEDKSLRIWRVSDWACVHVLGGHKAGITSLAVHPSGRLALSGSKDKTMRLWNLLEGRCAYISRFKEVPENIVWSPSGGSYAVLFRSKILVYRTGDGEITAKRECKGRIQDVLFLSEEQIVYSSVFGVLSVWLHTEENDEKNVVDLSIGVSERIRTLQKLDNSSTVVSATTNGLVHVWDIPHDVSESTKPLACLEKIVATGSRITCITAALRKSPQTKETDSAPPKRQESNAGTPDEKHKKKKKKKKKRKSSAAEGDVGHDGKKVKR